MRYKNIILGALLLVPCAAFSNDVTKAYIQQLQADLREKELELCELGKLIEEKQAWIDSITKSQHEFYAMVVALANNEERMILEKELDGFQEQVDNLDFSKDDMQKFLAEKAINSIKNSSEIKRIKAWCIRCKAEYYLLSNLTDRYEQCLQQFIDLDIQFKKIIA